MSSVLEGNTVSVFIPGKKYGEDADQQVSFPVQCSFWALTDASRQSGKMSENVLIGTAVRFLFFSMLKDLLKLTMWACTMLLSSNRTCRSWNIVAFLSFWKFSLFFFLEQELGAIPIQLADAFGLVIDSRDTMGDRSFFAQIVHTLQQAVQPGKHRYSSWEFSTQDYKEVNKWSVIDIPHVFTVKNFCFYIYGAELLSAFQLVAHARSLQVELSPEAEKIIHGYYMASRRVRTQTHGVKMSVCSVRLL